MRIVAQFYTNYHNYFNIDIDVISQIMWYCGEAFCISRPARRLPVHILRAVTCAALIIFPILLRRYISLRIKLEIQISTRLKFQVHPSGPLHFQYYFHCLNN